MKKYFLVSLISFSVLILSAQVNNESGNYFPEPRIDKRIELLSIVFRLAGNMEYSSDIYSSYTQDIHSHFNPYKEHPVISMASKLRIENGVSFDAVMKMAYHIDQPPGLTPRVQFSENVPERRWGTENAIEFLELLRDFYKVSDFEAFYHQHLEMYEIARKRFASVYNALQIEWFTDYFGVEPEGIYLVIISLGNGGGSYGGRVIFPEDRQEAYSILGTWKIDSTDLPVYTVDDYLQTLVHEFNHSFVNPLIDKYERQLEPSGTIIFDPVRDIMNKQAYGEWKIMMYESLVRASVIRYLLKYDSDDAAKKQLIVDTGRGFFWMKDLVDFLSEYENNREQYPTMESFMPELVQFFNKVAEDSKTMFEIKR